jgi:hypothetical protein
MKSIDELAVKLKGDVMGWEEEGFKPAIPIKEQGTPKNRNSSWMNLIPM